MIGFKVSLNNKVLFTAAHPDSFCQEASVTMFQGNTQFLSTFSTYKIETKEGLSKARQAFWEAPHLKKGDQVSITIVDIDTPSLATAHFDYGVKCPPHYSRNRHNCNFCGEEETETLILFERARGRICPSCVKFYSEVLEHNGCKNA